MATFAAIFLASFLDPIKLLLAFLLARRARRLPTKLLLGIVLAVAMEGLGTGLNAAANFGDRLLLNWMVCTLHVFIVSGAAKLVTAPKSEQTRA